MFKKIAAGLSILGVVGYVTIAFAAGLWPDLPVVGGATYCAGSSSTAIGSIIGSVTGCPNQVAAGPTILTGNEQIPADTRLGTAGAVPQTVLVPMASLNALPISFVTVTTPPAGISAANTSGGVVYSSTTTITSANITLPVNPIDGQQYAISSNRTITTLSVAAGGATNTIAGNSAPTALTATTTGAPQGYRFIFNLASTSWFRLQ